MHEQVRSGLDVAVGVEDLDGLALRCDHPESFDSAVAVAAVSILEQRQRIPVRLNRALRGVAALGRSPGGLGHERGLASDVLANLDTVAGEVTLLLARPPAAKLHGAVGEEVDPAPVRLRDEPRRRPRRLLAASRLAHENSSRERVPVGDLDVVRDVDPGGVDVAVVVVRLVELCRVVPGGGPRVGPDGLRLGLVEVGAASDLDAARGGVVDDRFEPNLYSLARGVPLWCRVQHPGGPAVVARLAEVVHLRACDSAGCTLADLHSVRGEPHLQVARVRSVDAAPVGAEHQDEGLAPRVCRLHLPYAHRKGCGDLVGAPRESAGPIVDEARLPKYRVDGLSVSGSTRALAGRIGVGHRPSPAVSFVDGMCSTLARVKYLSARVVWILYHKNRQLYT